MASATTTARMMAMHRPDMAMGTPDMARGSPDMATEHLHIDRMHTGPGTAIPAETVAPTDGLAAASSFIAQYSAIEAAYAAALSGLAQRSASSHPSASPFAPFPRVLAQAADAHAVLARTLAEHVQPALRPDPAAAAVAASISMQRASRRLSLAAEQAARQHLAAFGEPYLLSDPPSAPNFSSDPHSPSTTSVTMPHDPALPPGPRRLNKLAPVARKPEPSLSQQPQARPQAPPVGAPCAPRVQTTPTSVHTNALALDSSNVPSKSEKDSQQVYHTETGTASSPTFPPPYTEPAPLFAFADEKSTASALASPSDSTYYTPPKVDDNSTFRPMHRAGMASSSSLASGLHRLRREPLSGSAVPNESIYAGTSGSHLRLSQSVTSLPDMVKGEGYRNPLKSAFSRFGKPRPSQRRGRSAGHVAVQGEEHAPLSSSTPMSITTSAPGEPPGRSYVEDPPQPSPSPLKRSNTLGSIMSRRRKKLGSMSLSGGGSTDKGSTSMTRMPSRSGEPREAKDFGETGWDGVVYDDTLRQIYRTQGTSSIETHNLVYKATTPSKSSAGTSPLASARRLGLANDTSAPTSEDEAVDAPLARPPWAKDTSTAASPKGRTPLPPPQPVFNEEVRLQGKPSMSAAVLKWRSQSKSQRGGNGVSENSAGNSNEAQPVSTRSTLCSDRASSSLLASDDGQAHLLNPHGVTSTSTDGLSEPTDLPSPTYGNPPLSSSPLFPPRAGTAAPLNTITPLAVQPSVTETVNALLAGPQVRRLLVTGEVRISLDPLRSMDWLSQWSSETSSGGRGPSVPLHLTGTAHVDRCTPHPDFLYEIPSSTPQSGRTYLLKLDAVHAAAIKAVRQSPSPQQPTVSLPLFKYQVSLASMRASVPLDVGVQWRAEDGQASMLVSYKLNPECALLGEEALQHLRIAAPLGVAVKSARSKPAGQWDETTQTISWSLPPLSAAGGPSGVTGAQAEDDRILARFDTHGRAQPHPLAVYWAVPNRTLTPLRLAPLPGSDLAWGSMQRSTVAGKYLAVAPSA